MKEFSVEEVSKHTSDKDCWIIIKDKVFDMTPFLSKHPGGKKIVLNVAGKDATSQFNKFHNNQIFVKYIPSLCIGVVKGTHNTKDKSNTAKNQLENRSNTKQPVPTSNSVDASSQQSANSPLLQPQTSLEISNTEKEPHASFGDMVPFGDPNWYQEFNSPYYNESHIKLREVTREFVENEITPFVHEWDEQKKLPKEIFVKSANLGLLALVCGTDKAFKYFKGKLCAGLDPNKIDGFHELVVADEISRCGSAGFCWGIMGGLGIGLPPILHFATESIKQRVVPGVLSGEKTICLAITEPNVGSDVANLECTAQLSEDKKHYIVNGTKKWITNGVFADYFTTAVKTAPEKGMKGISLLLLERGMEGLTTRQMQCTGVWSSGTAYVSFEDVKVPVQNLIGEENKGFKCIMKNFNHERLGLVIQANRFSRVCYEDSVKYANKRKTFGKKLIQHPVIRDKLANMSRQIEATHHWIENIVYQMSTMDFETQMVRLGGPIALLKAQATRTFDYCAKESSQIFGGLSYSRGGQGEKIERLNREVKAYAIPGGSEEIMLDLGMRQSLKVAQMMGANF